MQQFYRNGQLIEWNPESPVITCLMSVYNGEEFLREAMDSILDQTYTNFEFLIINDGSTDDTVPIIESYDDPRIRLIHNEVNIGLTKSLNKGIGLAKGEYIARMDADDISLPERFERQIEVLLNSKIDICGTQGYVGKLNNDYVTNLPTSDFFIKL
ncbi:glycosyltransferase family 2 protein, partial [bacterium]